MGKKIIVVYECPIKNSQFVHVESRLNFHTAYQKYADNQILSFFTVVTKKETKSEAVLSEFEWHDLSPIFFL